MKEWIERYGDPRDPRVDPIDWVERIPFSETRNYVQRILENMQVYRVRFGGGTRLHDRGGYPPRRAGGLNASIIAPLPDMCGRRACRLRKALHTMRPPRPNGRCRARPHPEFVDERP